MFVKSAASQIGVLLAGAVTLLIPAMAVRGQQSPAVAPIKVDPKASAETDLEKQVEEALKEIDKLNKIVPDDVREAARLRVMQLRPVPIPIARSVGSAYTLGMQIQKPLPILVEHLQLPEMQGLVVNDVRPETIAARSGIKKFDILMEFNGKPVPSEVNAFNSILKDFKQNDMLTFGVIRRGKKETVKINGKLPDVVAHPTPVPLAVAPPIPANIVVPPIVPNAAPGVHRVLAFSDDNGSTRIQIAGNGFSADHKHGELTAFVTGKLDNGKAALSIATIQDGKARISARTLEQLPEQYRGTVASILARVK